MIARHLFLAFVLHAFVAACGITTGTPSAASSPRPRSGNQPASASPATATPQPSAQDSDLARYPEGIVTAARPVPVDGVIQDVYYLDILPFDPALTPYVFQPNSARYRADGCIAGTRFPTCLIKIKMAGK